MLTDHGPVDEQVHIQLGRQGDVFYVDHTGFGVRQVPDRRAAELAVKELTERHHGNWRTVDCDNKPFERLCLPDGGRFLYDTEDNCLYGHWGERKDARWQRYEKAFQAGNTFRRTETHVVLEGFIDAVAYVEPGTEVERFAVRAAPSGSEYWVVDYSDRAAAEARYEEEVRSNRSEKFPYQSCDVPEIARDRKADPPEGARRSGTVPAEAVDLGQPQVRRPGVFEWPTTASRALSSHVRAMAPGLRERGPGEVRPYQITPLDWRGEQPELWPNDLALLPLTRGGQLLASAADTAAYVWDVLDGSQVWRVAGHGERVLAVDLLELDDGRVMLATGGKDGRARVWAAREGQLVLDIVMPDRTPVNAIAWASPPGDVPWLVTAGDEAMVRVWDPDTGEVLAELEVGEPRADVVWSVAATVLADEHVCVVVGAYVDMITSVYVWDATAGELLHELEFEPDGRPAGVPQVAVTTVADGSFRFAVAIGGTIRVWDGLTGEPVGTFSLPDCRRSSVALAALRDHRVAVTASGGGWTVVWDAESGDELAKLTDGGDGYRHAVELVPTTGGGGVLLAVGEAGDTPARVLRLQIPTDGR